MYNYVLVCNAEVEELRGGIWRICGLYSVRGLVVQTVVESLAILVLSF
jgi:hypothetical protein